MTVYLIYKVPENLTPFLYAYTDKKYLMESFREERKERLFNIVKKDFTKEEYKVFSQKYHSHMLGRRGFETSSSSSDLLSNITHVYITATEMEEQDVIMKAESAVFEIGKHTIQDAQYFNTEILQALNDLYYFEIYKFVNANEFDPFYDGVKPFDIYESDEFRIDTLYIFIFLYGNTMKL